MVHIWLFVVGTSRSLIRIHQTGSHWSPSCFRVGNALTHWSMSRSCFTLGEGEGPIYKTLLVLTPSNMNNIIEWCIWKHNGTKQTLMLNQSHHFLKMLEDVKNTCIVYDKTELGNKTITVCNACTVSRPKFINRS